MISRLHRFHGYGSLNYVYQHGRTFRSPLLSLKAAPNERRRIYRCAVVISKKVNKSAVVRNRMRRRIFEIIRRAGIDQPYDIVITGYSEQLAGLTSDELSKSINSLLSNAGIIDKKSTEAPVAEPHDMIETKES